MNELTMFYGLMTIVYGKLWTVVQAFQTERAFLFCPNRITVLTRYGLFRTMLCTFIATNTLVFHPVEMLGLVLVVVGVVFLCVFECNGRSVWIVCSSVLCLLYTMVINP